MQGAKRSTLADMTKLLDQALEVVRGLPPEAQDDVARILLELARDDDSEPVTLSPDERTSIAVSKAAAARGKCATDGQVRAVWAKRDL
jgi:hypothetical protein